MQDHLLTTRRGDAKRLREIAADVAFQRQPAEHLSNGEESDYRNPDGELSYIANFSKSLRHNKFGETNRNDYRALVRAMTSGDPDHFEQLRLGRPDDGLNLVNPQAGFAFDLEGPDARSLTIPPAPRIDSPENSAEMGELYWMALLRDVHFSDYAAGNLPVDNAVADMNAFSDFRGPKDAGAVTPETLFRGFTPGDLTGPYVSQFLLVGNRDEDADVTPQLGYADGWIAYGTLKIDQRQKTAQGIPQNDFLTDFLEWREVQRGADRRTIKELFEPNRLFIRNLRDLATYVHYDALYEAYLNACLILLSIPTYFDPGNPYVGSKTQEGFGTFGGPHILSLVTEVATRALKAVWFQKWGVHRRLRPEAFGGRIHVHRNGINAAGVGQNRYDGFIDPEILASAAVPAIEAKYGSALLPIAFPEGSPTHPAYGAGHATVAGACVTILKAWFDESFVLPWTPLVANAAGTALVNAPAGTPPLTVGGELNKVAANVAIGRNGAGVHWRSDYTESVKLGETIAIGLLREQKLSYNENSALSLTKFDGTSIVI